MLLRFAKTDSCKSKQNEKREKIWYDELYVGKDWFINILLTFCVKNLTLWFTLRFFEIKFFTINAEFQIDVLDSQQWFQIMKI